ncbi:MAG: hypothetical protein AAF821_09665 [Cyanobacteria bacterium P01_D01_bin.156]
MAKSLGHTSPLGIARSLGSWVQRRSLGSIPLSILDLKTFYPQGFPVVPSDNLTTQPVETTSSENTVARQVDAAPLENAAAQKSLASAEPAVPFRNQLQHYFSSEATAPKNNVDNVSNQTRVNRSILSESVSPPTDIPAEAQTNQTSATPPQDDSRLAQENPVQATETDHSQRLAANIFPAVQNTDVGNSFQSPTVEVPAASSVQSDSSAIQRTVSDTIESFTADDISPQITNNSNHTQFLTEDSPNPTKQSNSETIESAATSDEITTSDDSHNSSKSPGGTTQFLSEENLSESLIQPKSKPVQRTPSDNIQLSATDSVSLSSTDKLNPVQSLTESPQRGSVDQSEHETIQRTISPQKRTTESSQQPFTHTAKGNQSLQKSSQSELITQSDGNKHILSQTPADKPQLDSFSSSNDNSSHSSVANSSQSSVSEIAQSIHNLQPPSHQPNPLQRVTSNSSSPPTPGTAPSNTLPPIGPTLTDINQSIQSLRNPTLQRATDLPHSSSTENQAPSSNTQATTSVSKEQLSHHTAPANSTDVEQSAIQRTQDSLESSPPETVYPASSADKSLPDQQSYLQKQTLSEAPSIEQTQSVNVEFTTLQRTSDRSKSGTIESSPALPTNETHPSFMSDASGDIFPDVGNIQRHTSDDRRISVQQSTASDTSDVLQTTSANLEQKNINNRPFLSNAISSESVQRSLTESGTSQNSTTSVDEAYPSTQNPARQSVSTESSAVARTIEANTQIQKSENHSAQSSADSKLGLHQGSSSSESKTDSLDSIQGTIASIETASNTDAVRLQRQVFEQSVPEDTPELYRAGDQFTSETASEDTFQKANVSSSEAPANSIQRSEDAQSTPSSSFSTSQEITTDKATSVQRTTQSELNPIPDTEKSATAPSFTQHDIDQGTNQPLTSPNDWRGTDTSAEQVTPQTHQSKPVIQRQSGDTHSDTSLPTQNSSLEIPNTLRTDSQSIANASELSTQQTDVTVQQASNTAEVSQAHAKDALEGSAIASTFHQQSSPTQLQRSISIDNSQPTEIPVTQNKEHRLSNLEPLSTSAHQTVVQQSIETIAHEIKDLPVQKQPVSSVEDSEIAPSPPHLIEASTEAISEIQRSPQPANLGKIFGDISPVEISSDRQISSLDSQVNYNPVHNSAELVQRATEEHTVSTEDIHIPHQTFPHSDERSQETATNLPAQSSPSDFGNADVIHRELESPESISHSHSQPDSAQPVTVNPVDGYISQSQALSQDVTLQRSLNENTISAVESESFNALTVSNQNLSKTTTGQISIQRSIEQTNTVEPDSFESLTELDQNPSSTIADQTSLQRNPEHISTVESDSFTSLTLPDQNSSNTTAGQTSIQRSPEDINTAVAAETISTSEAFSPLPDQTATSPAQPVSSSLQRSVDSATAASTNREASNALSQDTFSGELDASNVLSVDDVTSNTIQRSTNGSVESQQKLLSTDNSLLDSPVLGQTSASPDLHQPVAKAHDITTDAIQRSINTPIDSQQQQPSTLTTTADSKHSPELRQSENSQNLPNTVDLAHTLQRQADSSTEISSHPSDVKPTITDDKQTDAQIDSPKLTDRQGAHPSHGQEIAIQREPSDSIDGVVGHMLQDSSIQFEDLDGSVTSIEPNQPITSVVPNTLENTSDTQVQRSLSPQQTNTKIQPSESSISQSTEVADLSQGSSTDAPNPSKVQRSLTEPGRQDIDISAQEIAKSPSTASQTISSETADVSNFPPLSEVLSASSSIEQPMQDEATTHPWSAYQTDSTHISHSQPGQDTVQRASDRNSPISNNPSPSEPLRSHSPQTAQPRTENSTDISQQPSIEANTLQRTSTPGNRLNNRLEPTPVQNIPFQETQTTEPISVSESALEPPNTVQFEHEPSVQGEINPAQTNYSQPSGSRIQRSAEGLNANKPPFMQSSSHENQLTSEVQSSADLNPTQGNSLQKSSTSDAIDSQESMERYPSIQWDADSIEQTLDTQDTTIANSPQQLSDSSRFSEDTSKISIQKYSTENTPISPLQDLASPLTHFHQSIEDNALHNPDKFDTPKTVSQGFVDNNPSVQSDFTRARSGLPQESIGQNFPQQSSKPNRTAVEAPETSIQRATHQIGPLGSVSSLRLPKVLRPLGVLKPLPSLQKATSEPAQSTVAERAQPIVHSSDLPPSKIQAKTAQPQENNDDIHPLKSNNAIADIQIENSLIQKKPEDPTQKIGQDNSRTPSSETSHTATIPSEWSNLADLVNHLHHNPSNTTSQPSNQSLPQSSSSKQNSSPSSSQQVTQPSSTRSSSSAFKPTKAPTVTVQRQTVSSNKPTIIQASQDSTTTQVGNAPQEDEPNYSQYLELLAQEVYGLLRQRLSLEQERRGPKYPR